MNRKLHRKRNSVFKRLIVGILKLMLFAGVPLLLFGFTFQMKNITVTGLTRYTEEQMKDMLIKTNFDHNTLLFYLKYKYFEDLNIPFVEKIDMELRNNNSIDIRVYEKRVTGCVEFMGQFLYFDKDGIVVESSSEHFEDIPQIKGLKFNKIILYEKLEIQKDELFDVILNLTQLIEKYELNVNAIRFNSDNEVVLDFGKISAQLGRKGTYEVELSELKNILAEAKGEIDDILDKSDATELEIDMRDFERGSDTIIAKPKKTTD